MDQDDSNGHGENCVVSGYYLKVELIGLANNLPLRYEINNSGII